MKHSWKQVRYRLEYFACRLLAGLIPRLPRRACLSLAHLLGLLYYRLDGKGRAAARENLRLALGDTLDATARERAARASFLNFSRAMLDLFWARKITRENFRKYLHPQGFEHAKQVLAQHKSVIFVVIHHGAYEWLSLTAGFLGIPVSIVMLDFKNSSLDNIFRRAREHSGHHLIGQHQSMLKLLRAVRQRGGAGMLIDSPLRLHLPGAAIDAFGMKMHATMLHALLHTRTGVPMVPLTSVPHPDGSCTVTAHPPLAFLPGTSHQEITQRIWDFFEPFIRDRPDLWLWSYRYWRYKPKRATREYPFYAATDKRFDQAIAAAQTSPTTEAQKPVG